MNDYLPPMSSPDEQRTPVFNGPAPVNAAGRFPTGSAAAWEMLALRHPRKYKKAMQHVAWLNRMHAFYMRRVDL